MGHSGFSWRSCSRWCGVLALSLVALLLTPASGADRHEGVASCAGSTCHAATQPLGRHGLRQDEYFTWQQRDPHARAYAVLLNERSRRIGRVLGLRPQEAPECLVCHTDHPEPAQRGERFLLGDGIGCERCHGGSERWLAEHTRPGLSLDDKQAMGMYPTWQPRERAALCLACHQGDAQHPISHAMMVAGHPPLLFELDTFGALAAPHHDLDADYQQRKGDPDSARVWVVGQAVAAEKLLAALAQPELVQGLFPDLMQFDCQACHHRMSEPYWRAGRAGAVPAGTPPYADSSLQWLSLWLGVMAPDLVVDWQAHWQKLQRAQRLGAPAVHAAATAQLQFLSQSVMPRLQRVQATPAQLRALLREIGGLRSGAWSGDFHHAEQAAMTAMVFAEALRARGHEPPAALGTAINRLYAAVGERERFDPQAYERALEQLATVAAR